MKSLTKIILISIFIFYYSPNLIFAQSPDTLWTKTFGGIDKEVGRSLQITFDSSYIVAANIGKNPHEDLLILKTDNLGNLIWYNRYPTGYSDIINFISQTADSGFIITGGDGLRGKLLLVKIDKNGEEVWRNYYQILSHFTYGYCGIQTLEGGYIVTGKMNSRLLILKLNEQGETEWWKTMGDQSSIGRYIIQTNDKNYIVCGSIHGNTNNVYIVKVDSIGHKIWEKYYEGEGGASSAYCVEQIADGGLIFTGTQDVKTWLLRTNELGDTLWTKILIGDIGLEVKEIYTGGFITLGYDPPLGDILIRTDDFGDIIWTKHFKRSLDDRIYSFDLSPDLSYILCGYTTSLADTTKDIWLIKMMPDLTAVKYSNNGESFFHIEQNYPNPFNPKTKIKYQIPELSFVTIKVYDILGKEIITLVNEEQPIGNYEVDFNGKGLPSGIYFYRIQADSFVETKKMVLMR